MARTYYATRLWQRYEQERTTENRNALVEHYLPSVDRIFRSVIGRLPNHVDAEAVKAAGVLGLIRSVERFDRARGFTFASFAWRRIAGAMRDEMRRMDHLTRSDRRAAQQHEQHQLHVIAVADVLRVDDSDPRSDTDEAADDMLFVLPVREATVVYLRIWKGLSMAEIADAMRMSQSGVSRIYGMAIDALRRAGQVACDGDMSRLQAAP